MRRTFLAACAVAGIAGTAAADCAPGLPGAPNAGPIEIEVETLNLWPGDFYGVRLLGAYRLSTDHGGFGGISGLLIEEGGSGIVMATDRGRWVTGRLVRDARGMVSGLEEGRTQRMQDGNRSLRRGYRDSEGLTRIGGTILVSFEREHRIMRCDQGGALKPFAAVDDWNLLPDNRSLEGLATMPDGRILVIAEAPEPGQGFPFWVLSPDGRSVSARGFLPQGDRHHLTAADYGPDGVLYVLERDYSQLRGVSIRLVRYFPDKEGLPLDRSAELLAQFDSATGIDNMEGIAVWRDGAGRMIVSMISDDNFSDVQRTILVELEVLR